ncbi:MAG TPA: YceD family protein, partial [Burkholderiaceae bacterium]
DVASAAAESLSLEGRWPLAGFERLVEGASEGSDGGDRDGEARWSALAQQRPVAGGEPEIWLHLMAQARVWRDCQRCLQPVAIELDVARALRFVADEATAEALDAESEDDVLALPRWLDLHTLVEDELLLALPLVPMHAECPAPPNMTVGDISENDAVPPLPHPFAALAGLKRRRTN